jgi:hypothetical protein
MAVGFKGEKSEKEMGGFLLNGGFWKRPPLSPL